MRNRVRPIPQGSKIVRAPKIAREFAIVKHIHFGERWQIWDVETGLQVPVYGIQTKRDAQLAIERDFNLTDSQVTYHRIVGLFSYTGIKYSVEKAREIFNSQQSEA